MIHPRPTRATHLGSLVLILFLLAGLLAGCSVAEDVKDVVTAPFAPSVTGRKGPSLPMTVVVAPFTSTMPEYVNRSVELGRSVSNALEADAEVTMGDYQRLDAESRSVASPGDTTMARLFKAARQSGVNTMISGAIVDLSVRRRLKGVYGFRDNIPFLGMEAHLTIHDLANGTIVGESSFRSEMEVDEVLAQGIEQGNEPPKDKVDQLQVELSAEAVEWVQDTLPEQEWTGFIISVNGDRIIITGGSNNGFTPGSVVHVYTPGQPIKTGSGLTLYLLGAKVGALKVVEPKKSTSLAVVDSQVEGEDKKITFRTGMMLKAY